MSIDRYAVIGNPVEHSKSPRIHQLFAEQVGQKISYDKLLAPRNDFAGTLKRFHAEGGRGANITLPFKLEALALSEDVTDRAQRAGAVNTVTLLPDGRILGDNTDGIGLFRDLTINHGLDLKGQNILVLGAGGAARGILGPLFDAGPVGITLANRTVDKAKILAAEFGVPNVIDGCSYADLHRRHYDIIINATSAGLKGEIPPLSPDVLEPDGTCYDMLYGDSAEPFMQWARSHGAAKVCDGLGMLVEQAAESFFIWRGVRPDSAPVLRALRNSA